jgi:hypothetical protein
VLQRDGACLREGVARRPRTAGGMGTDGTGAATAAATHDPHSSRGCRRRACLPRLAQAVPVFGVLVYVRSPA